VAAGLALALAAGADAAPLEGIHKIQHVVMIMQENRSFDTYFGTYPGAHGIPAGVCVPDPVNGGCVRPFYNANEKNRGGPHGAGSTVADIDGGKMDGFVAEAEGASECTETGGCGQCKVSECGVEVMGYHDARQIPNYWTYAEDFVLQDNMFASTSSWSLPEHLYLVSGWSAVCPQGDGNPLECVGTLNPAQPAKSWSAPLEPGRATYAWTDITHLMHKDGVSWRYYVHEGEEPDCEDDEALSCAKVKQNAKTPGIWNPLADFTDVQQDGQLANIQPLPNFFEAVHAEPSCGLPNVSWIVPSGEVSEHPPSKIAPGQAYVTTLINSIMRGPCWGSTAIFLSWDDWGGYYDNVLPPGADENGYGLRVPGLVISPYAKTGYIDHQQLSHDAYLKFIEDDFMAGERLNRATDGRPDLRPDVREEAPGLGDLANDFDFSQQPRPPLLLPTDPEPGPASKPPGSEQKAPTVLTGEASSLARTSATLKATVNPNLAAVSACHFEYGTSTLYGSSVPCMSLPEYGEKAVPVWAPVEGLSAGTAYYFRIVATNSGGTSYGAAQTFTTTTAEGLPELGRCVGVKAANGKYADANCTTKSTGEDTGPHEWNPEPSVDFGFKGTLGATRIGPQGAWEVHCTAGTYDGGVTGARTARGMIVLEGCTSAGSRSSCQSSGSVPGTIETDTLEGELGYIAAGADPSVGLELKPTGFTAPIVVSYECGGAGSGVRVSEHGSVIASISSDEMSTSFQLQFKISQGHQNPESFEGGPEDVLTALLHLSESESREKSSAWRATVSGSFEEPLEIKGTA